MESVLIYCVVVLVIGGLLAYLVNAAPMIEAGLKQIAVWAILAVTIILIVVKLLALI